PREALLHDPDRGAPAALPGLGQRARDREHQLPPLPAQRDPPPLRLLGRAAPGRLPQPQEREEGLMLHLRATSDATWGARAAEHLDEILLDHAHLEKKAAAAAMNLLFRYVDRPLLM